MPQLLSLLTITGYGTYADFYPTPFAHTADFLEGDFHFGDFHTRTSQEESPLAALITDTKLLSPLEFEESLPDDFDGSIGTRRFSAELANVTKIAAPRQLLGVVATGALWEVDSNTLIHQQTGIITEVNCGPERIELTIEQDATVPLQTLVPRRLVKDIFPSADFTGLSTNGDPCVVIPWGTLYKVPLPLCQRPYFHFAFTMTTAVDSWLYMGMTGVPNYLVQSGDVLTYDVSWQTADTFIAMDVAATDTTNLRDSGTYDGGGLASHPRTDLSSAAVGKWYRREIRLDALVGKTLGYYMVACEANTAGVRTAFIANAQIVSGQGELRLNIINELASPTFTTISNTGGNSLAINRTDFWVYGPVRTPTSGALTFNSVYRGSAAISSSEYAIYEPIVGLTAIRFSSPQRDTNGEPATISATISSTEFLRNPAKIQQFIIGDATDGCGAPVDDDAFGTAGVELSNALIFAEGGLTTQRSAIDVINDLTFYGSSISVNDSGEYTASVDSLASHVLSTLEMGEGDGEVENVNFAPASFRLLDQIKSLTIKAFEVADFGGGSSFAVSAVRTQAVNGSTITDQEPYLSHASADRETYYRFVRNAYGALYRAEVTADSMELLPVGVDDLVTVRCPADAELDGRTMVVTGRKLSAESMRFSLRGWNALIYSYISAPVQQMNIPPLIDYRFTIPATPTSFIVWSQSPQVTSDGSVKTYVTVQATAPNFNVAELRFRAIPVGSVLFVELPVVVTLGQTGVRAVFALEPGLSYHYEVYAYNGANAPGFRYSAAAQLLSQTVDGDLTAPTAASAILVRQTGTKTVEIEATFTPPSDWGTTLLYRNTVNVTASAVLIESAKKKIFHDQNIVYDTTYYYWVKIADNTWVATANAANVSGFSPSSSNSILISRLLTDDYTDLSLTTGKMANLAVTSAKIANLAVTNAKINDLNASKITAGSLRVDQVSTGASEIYVDAPSKLRMESMVGSPAKIVFENAAGTELASIAGDASSQLRINAVGAVVIVDASKLNVLGQLYGQTYAWDDAPGLPGAGAQVARLQVLNLDGTLKGYIRVFAS